MSDCYGKCKIKSVLIFLFVLIVLFCFYPYEFYSVYFIFLPQRALETCLVLIIPVLLVYLFSKKKSSPTRKVCLFAILQWFGYSLASINRGNINAVVSQTLLLIFTLLLVFLVEQTIGLQSFYKKYNRWIFIMAALGTLTWFLMQFFNYTPLYFLPDRAENGRMIYNYGITFATMDESSSLRYAGFFDEPGAMGYWGMFALIMNRLFVKEKWLEIPLVFCLLFTFSIGYYIQLALFFILFSFSKQNFSKNILLCLVLFISVWTIISTKNTDLGFVYDMTVGRLEGFGEYNHGFSVDNRTESSELALREFWDNPLLGTQNLELNVGNNMYEPLALYGIIGTFFIYFPFLWLLVSSFLIKDYEIFKASIVVIVGFAHRPFHSNLLYFFVLYSILILYIQRRKIA